MFISLRARYLNVAIMKTTKMRLDHIPTTLFSRIFWRKTYDNQIQPLKDNETFLRALKLILYQFHCFQKSYNFIIFIGVTTIVVGSLFTVQGIIAYDEMVLSMLEETVVSPEKIDVSPRGTPLAASSKAHAVLKVPHPNSPRITKDAERPDRIKVDTQETPKKIELRCSKTHTAKSSQRCALAPIYRDGSSILF
ncbi:unnamed protein product [Chilo suppressalis]|uniref:Uncharacterized protein n=1 Tax=Chilo suppressalis TaxID=168631 RepID=A0ABN8AQ00_CHISP|nr:unnamed protein product [Chilo suppressalis]